MNDASVSCYKNTLGAALVVPFAKNAQGWRVQVNKVLHLPHTASPVELGAAIRQAASWCDYSLFDPALGYPALVASGEKGPQVFARKWDLVTVHIRESIRIAPSSKDHAGRYWGLPDEAVSLSATVTDDELGRTVLQIFGKCRWRIKGE